MDHEILLQEAQPQTEQEFLQWCGASALQLEQLGRRLAPAALAGILALSLTSCNGQGVPSDKGMVISVQKGSFETASCVKKLVKDNPDRPDLYVWKYDNGSLRNAGLRKVIADSKTCRKTFTVSDSVDQNHPPRSFLNDLHPGDTVVVSQDTEYRDNHGFQQAYYVYDWRKG